MCFFSSAQINDLKTYPELPKRYMDTLVLIGGNYEFSNTEYRKMFSLKEIYWKCSETVFIHFYKEGEKIGKKVNRVMDNFFLKETEFKKYNTISINKIKESYSEDCNSVENLLLSQTIYIAIKDSNGYQLYEVFSIVGGTVDD